MASNTKNVKLGVCQVFLDNVDLGYTQGGVEVSVSTDTHKVNVDQFGKTSINEYIQGREVKVKCPLAETTLRNMVATMPGSELVTDGVQASGTLTVASQPAADSKVTVAGRDFTFKGTAPASVYEVRIGASKEATAQGLADAINISQLALDKGGVVASLLGAVITVKSGDTGTAGNEIALASASVAVTVSGAKLAGGAVETRARVDVKTGVGLDMLKQAKQLRLHPVGKEATDLSEDFIVFRTATPGALQFAYKTDAERVFNVEFMGYPDPTTNMLFSFGDPLAVNA